MTTYLIDYENVNAGGLAGIDKLGEEQEVVIFYSQQADTLTFSLYKKLAESPAQVVLIKVEGNSKNSLDFQLASYLGYQIARDGRREYCIVSKDNGFGVLCPFWKEVGARVTTAPNIQQTIAQPALPPVKQLPAASKQAVPQKPQTAAAPDKLQELLPQYEDELPVIREFLQKYKTKQGFNNALTKQFGSEKTGIIYKAVKSLLVDKKGK